METATTQDPRAQRPPADARVLLVDDDEEMRALVGEWLGELGCEVVPARHGQEALELLDAAAFDILFTDIYMPGRIDGFELAMAAADRQPRLKVFFASGAAWGPAQDEDPGSTFLHKPYTRAELVATLRKVMAT